MAQVACGASAWLVGLTCLLARAQRWRRWGGRVRPSADDVYRLEHTPVALVFLGLALAAGCGDRERVATDTPASITAPSPAPAAPHGFDRGLPAQGGTPPIETVVDDESPARFILRDGHAAAFFRDSGFALSLPDADRRGRRVGVHWSLPGARTVPPRGEARRSGRVHSMVGPRARWRTDLPTFGRVVWPGVYPGVALEVEPRRGGMEYRFALDAGADPDAIRLRVDGVDGARVAADGAAIVLATRAGELREDQLRCWQPTSAGRRPVACRFTEPTPRGGGHEYGFVVEALDPAWPLVIDPTVDWSTFLGADGGTTPSSAAAGVALDAVGNVYVTGQTTSADFPSVGGFATTLGGASDVFVTKVAANGSGVVWSTYLGGAAGEMGTDLAVAASGDVFLGGWTWSSDFPVVGGFDTTMEGTSDAFAASIAADGSALVWSTLVGGSASDNSYGMALDGAGNVYLTGVTNSPDFPVAGAIDATLGGGGDAFIAKIAAGGGSLLWSTYLGGAGGEVGYGLDVDAVGSVYVAGDTSSDDFAIVGGVDDTLSGGGDAFVAKVAADGGSVLWSTYLGGGSADRAHAVAVDGSGNVYVAGYTLSGDFPTNGGFDTSYGGSQDAFVTAMATSGSGLLWSSYLGGIAKDDAWGVALDATGVVHVSGETASADFPTAGGFDTSYNGGIVDAFVARVAVGGGSLAWSSYLGGAASDYGFAVAATGAGAAVSGTVVVGSTTSVAFPSNGGFDTSFGGSRDAYVTKVNAAGTSLAWSSYLGGSLGRDSANACAVTASGDLYVVGSTESTAFPVPGAYEPDYRGGGEDAVVARYAPDGTLAWATYLGGRGTDEALGVAVDANGAPYVTGYTLSSDFPIVGGFDATLGGTDAFVTKLDPSGTSLAYSTFLGGAATEHGNAIAVDSGGNAYVTGYTGSGDYPSVGGFDASRGGTIDAYVAKVAAGGASLVWSSYLGGAASDEGNAIALDGDANVVVVGDTSSTDFPTSGGFDVGADGAQDAFVTKVSAAGSSLAWSSYLGSTSNDYGEAVAVSATGDIYVAGLTTSSSFPSQGGFDTTYGGANDAYVTRVAGDGSAIVWSSFLGSNGNDGATALAIDADGDLHVGGRTSSASFPTVAAADATHGGSFDGFVTKVDVVTVSIAWSTYLGGSDEDYLNGLAVDGAGNTYAVGRTLSSNFPTSSGLDTTFGASQDIFVTRINALARPQGQACAVGGECASGFCADGVCCDSACNGECDRCDAVGQEGSCQDDASLCDGNCARCSAGSCSGDSSRCTGNCAACNELWGRFECGPDPFFSPCGGTCGVCAGSGTEFNCAADASRCTGNCDVCGGSGSVFDCAPDGSLCSGNCGGSASCAGSGSSYSCVGDDTACTGNCDTCACVGTECACDADESLCTGSCAACAGAGTAFDCVGDEAACPGACESCAGGGTSFACAPSPSTTVCRAATDLCDAEERCTGASPSCPADGVLGAAAICRPAAGSCDVAERCDGLAASCPADAVVMDQTACDDGNDCTANDRCASGQCQGGGPALVMSPNPVAFPDTVDGSQSAPVTVTLENVDEHGGVLVVTSVATTAPEFAVTVDPTAAGAVALTQAAAPATAAVAFTPSGEGTFDETLIVTTDNPSCRTFEAALRGIGVADGGAPDAGPSDAGADGGPAPTSRGGCGCRVATSTSPADEPRELAGLVVLLTVAARRRRPRRTPAFRWPASPRRAGRAAHDADP